MENTEKEFDAVVNRKIDIDNNDEDIEDVTNKLLCKICGVEKMRIKMPDMTNKDIQVGRKFYSLAIDNKIETVIITYVRSGVAFYTSDLEEGEQHFPLGCVWHAVLEPEEYVCELDSKYFEMIAPLGRTKFIYNKNSK